MQLYNTYSKTKETFRPLEAGRVKLYTCGPTVYDYVTIGNLRSYVMADTLRRVLAASGLEVQHVKNITDVGHLTADDLGQGDSGEDKLAKKAATEGKTPADIAAFYTEYYHRTEAALNILPATVEPRATEYVPQMIAFIERLIERGFAYESNHAVFFDVTKYADYGKLSGNTLEQLKVGARLEEHPDKRHPWDFALWLPASEGHLMRWESPWGVGYPGWHIECSAMNLATLGATIDIHTGGEDNIFPHHEAEIAQSTCGNDAPFARYWVHTRHLLVDGVKMSKSKGNFYRLEDILERGYTAMDLRMLYLSAHYRSQMNFTWEALAQAKVNREKVESAWRRLRGYVLSEAPLSDEEGPKPDKSFSEFFEYVKDDLNTPAALAALLAFVNILNLHMDAGDVLTTEMKKESIVALEKMLLIFGLHFEEKVLIPAAVMKLIEERKAARDDKDFSRSDALRDEIAAQGWIVEDGPSGQSVRKK